MTILSNEIIMKVSAKYLRKLKNSPVNEPTETNRDNSVMPSFSFGELYGSKSEIKLASECV